VANTRYRTARRCSRENSGDIKGIRSPPGTAAMGTQSRAGLSFFNDVELLHAVSASPVLHGKLGALFPDAHVASHMRKHFAFFAEFKENFVAVILLTHGNSWSRSEVVRLPL
jgi:hypothetical protein